MNPIIPIVLVGMSLISGFWLYWWPRLIELTRPRMTKGMVESILKQGEWPPPYGSPENEALLDANLKSQNWAYEESKRLGLNPNWSKKDPPYYLTTGDVEWIRNWPKVSAK